MTRASEPDLESSPKPVAAVRRRSTAIRATVMAAVVTLCCSSTGASALSSMREARTATVGASSLSVAPRQAFAFPSTFVGARDGRLAVFRSRDGSFARYLTDRPVDLGLPSVTPNRTKVFYVRVEPDACVATYVVPMSGGESRLARRGTRGGGQPIAAGPSGALAGNYACIASTRLVTLRRAALQVDW